MPWLYRARTEIEALKSSRVHLADHLHRMVSSYTIDTSYARELLGGGELVARFLTVRDGEIEKWLKLEPVKMDDTVRNALDVFVSRITDAPERMVFRLFAMLLTIHYSCYGYRACTDRQLFELVPGSALPLQPLKRYC